MKYLSITICLVLSISTLFGMDSGWETETIKTFNSHHIAERYGDLTSLLRTILDGPNALYKSAYAFKWVEEKADTGDVPLMYLHIRAKLTNTHETPETINKLVSSMLILLIRVHQDNAVCSAMAHDGVCQGVFNFFANTFWSYYQPQNRFVAFKKKCYWWFRKLLTKTKYQESFKKALEWFDSHPDIAPQPAWICPAYQNPASKTYSITFQNVNTTLYTLYQQQEIKELSKKHRATALEQFKTECKNMEKWDDFFKDIQEGGDDRIGN